MSNPRYGSGRKQFVGQGIEADLGKLDPAAYPGAVAYSDGELYYSDGSEWVVPQDEVDIARPRNLSPTTSTEQSQLRLSSFRSPTGESQTGIIFEANADGLPDFGQGANLITRVVTSQVASMYQVVYPDDGFQPGETIWWRARYLGTNGTQSQFSIPTAQIFPDLITTPSPVTPAFAITGTVTATAYDSPAIFSLTYFNTTTEFYAANAVPGVDAPTATVTHTNGATTTIPSGLAAGVAQYWRTRYSGRVSIGSPLVTSAWSVLRGVVPGGQSMILEYNLTLASARTIGLPLNGTVNVTVNWGDGITEAFTTAGVKTHTYASGFGPTVLVTITGTMTQFGTQSITAAQAQGLTRVENWGFGLGLTSLAYALYRTSANLIFVSPTLPPTVTTVLGFMENSTSNVDLSALDVSNVTNMSYMFRSATNFNNGGSSGINNWNTSKVTNMQGVFSRTVNSVNMVFNQPIGNWDVSKVTNMQEMFGGQNNTIAFNQNINTWNVSSVTDMGAMFQSANAFNQPLGNWNVSNVTNMGFMFWLATAFNQNINTWNVSKVTNMNGMFYFAIAYNQPMNNWVTSAVTNMSIMFGTGANGSMAFNQPIGNWDVSNVTNMSGMFQGNANSGHAFNQNIGAWNVSKVTNMNTMFYAENVPTAFNNGGSPDINNWNTIAVTSMSSMFRGVGSSFNQNIGGWNVSNVTNMSFMFNQNRAFNNGGSPNINNWNVSKVTDMSNMFSYATSFNQPIGSWNMSAVTNMQLFMGNTGNSTIHSFNQPIGDWDVSKVTSFDVAFYSNNAIDQNLGNWKLRPAGVNFGQFRSGSGWSAENYSRTLIGWANYVAATDGPYSSILVIPLVNAIYNANNYVPGARFTNAVAARAFLVGARVVSVTGSSDTNANTTYTYNGTTQTYDAANGWKFAILASAWGLYDASAVLQATGTGGNIGTGPHTVTSWTGVLSAATVLRTGASWTITGDAAA